MKTLYDRTQMLIGEQQLNHLKKKKVIIFGVGGVGGFTIESLARVGIGHLTIVDFDTVDVTNINRQIIALNSTLGRLKTQVMEERIADINSDIRVIGIPNKLTKENICDFSLQDYDYIVDAIDDVGAKLLLISYAKQMQIPIISSMGTGNKFDPTQFKITDIKKTHTCPLAKVMRKELGKMGVKDVKVLFSPEIPHREEILTDGDHSPSSISFVPATSGLLIAWEVVRMLIMTGPTEKKMFGIKY